MPAGPPIPPETLAIRYRHPVSGDTWDGQGDHPPWLRDALLKQGYTVDELKRAVNEGGAPDGKPPVGSATWQGLSGRAARWRSRAMQANAA